MQNPNNVTTQAFEGMFGEISIELGISDKRLYEMLGRDNPYTKTWRLLTPLGRLDPDRLELMRADFNARCDRIVGRKATPSTAATVHKEVSEAVQAIIEKAPRAERRRQITEAIAELNKELHKIDEGDNAADRVVRKFTGTDGGSNSSNAIN